MPQKHCTYTRLYFTMEGENVDILELLAEQSDSDPPPQATQPDPEPTPSGGNGNTQTSSHAQISWQERQGMFQCLTREEFSTVQNQLTAMADALDNIQTAVLTSLSDRPAKKQKIEESSSSGEDSVEIDKAVSELLQ
ncbi:uncharacterized protein LOC119743543 [Patiria miniata]|uniref:Uncharacterized protein n=1 Tax=Patiria miniata TaxID=46514 RepID=A0A914BKB4_PATMI|nr:uncharacterized protein LOC119743543 [Patiria miniata]